MTSWQSHRKIFRLLEGIKKRKTEVVVTLASFLIYLVLLFEKLPDFPPYFFCDEAIVGVEAHSVLTTGKDQFGVAFPIFFRGLGQYQQSLAIYLQIPAIALFGLNEFAIRFTNAFVGFFGVIAAYLLIRYVYKTPEVAWLTFAVFALSPLWFLHNRTGFEVVIASAFFLGFWLFYILAFTRRPWYIVPATICGAAAFYAYTPGRGWILISFVPLFLFNIREHIRYWKRTLIGLALFTLLLSPYIHFHLKYPERAMKRLDSMYLYVPKTANVLQQAKRMAENYLLAFNPAYWYTWEGCQDIESVERHVIPRLPQLWLATLPFVFVGLFITLRHIRKLQYRTLLALLIAVPFPASLIHFNTLRGMPVGLIILILSLIGMGWLFHRIQRWPRCKWILQGIILIGVASYAIWFRHHVYTVAPYSYRDYGFYGLQMGAPEVFRWINEHHHEYEQVLISPNLFNMGEIFLSFYLRGEAARKSRIFDMTNLYKNPHVLDDNAIYIAPFQFYIKLQAKGLPVKKETIHRILDLQGKPLFEIARYSRKPSFDTWFQTQNIDRKKLLSSQVSLQGTMIQLEHPQFDLGTPANMFDSNKKTIARSAAINPAQFVIHLPGIPLKQVSVTMCNNHGEISIKTRSHEHLKDWGTQQYSGIDTDHTATLTFQQPEAITDVTALEINARATDADHYGFVHIAEIAWE